MDTLVEDIRHFLDQQQIHQAHLVGHSFAGTELTRLASLYPQRVARLVYLDAAHDYSGIPTLMANHPVSFTPSEQDLADTCVNSSAGAS